jgi:hypothetical protein
MYWTTERSQKGTVGPMGLPEVMIAGEGWARVAGWVISAREVRVYGVDQPGRAFT